VVASKPASSFMYFTKPIPRWLRRNPVGNFARALALGAEVISQVSCCGNRNSRTFSLFFYTPFSRCLPRLLYRGHSIVMLQLDPPVRARWVAKKRHVHDAASTWKRTLNRGIRELVALHGLACPDFASPWLTPASTRCRSWRYTRTWRRRAGSSALGGGARGGVVPAAGWCGCGGGRGVCDDTKWTCTYHVLVQQQ